jgi:hypothetical protein
MSGVPCISPVDFPGLEDAPEADAGAFTGPAPVSFLPAGFDPDAWGEAGHGDDPMGAVPGAFPPQFDAPLDLSGLPPGPGPWDP